MADPKYRAGQIPVNSDQMAAIEKAMVKFHDENGIQLSRSQMLAALAHWYAAGRLTKDGLAPQKEG